MPERNDPAVDDELVHVLLVEDQAYRAERIVTWLCHPRVRIARARTADEAAAALQRTELTLVLLDYDLDEAHPERAAGLTHGGHVAALLARLPARLQPSFVVIHSMNERGQAEMLRVLEAAGIPTEVRPFDRWDDAFAARLLGELLES